MFCQPEDNNDYNHGEVLQQGDQFPISPNEGEYFVRTDFTPNRLFVRRGSKWHRLYDNITEQTWSDRTYNASQFINNDATTVVDNKEQPEKQALSQVVKPKSDFE